MNAEYATFLAHLESHDPPLHQLALACGPLSWPERRPPFEALLRAIIGQQVSTQAAATIFNRFRSLFDEVDLTAENVLRLNAERLRSCGLSNQKATYVHAVATAWSDEPERFGRLDTLSDNEVLSALTQIKGVGEWTAQMFLMFTLHRPDVFAPKDLGLKKAMANLYGLAMENPLRDFERIAERWSPYRSWASYVLWASLQLEKDQPK